MATTINTFNGWNVRAIGEEMLPALSQKLAPLSAFSTDFSSDAAKKGTGISTTLLAPMSASIFDATTGYAGTARTTNAVTVDLIHHFHCSQDFSPSEVAANGVDVLQKRFIVPAVDAIGRAVQERVFGLVVATNYPSFFYSASAASFGLANLNNGVKTLTKSGSLGPYSAVLNPDVYFPLATTFTSAVVQDASVVRTGNIGTIGGAQVWLDATVPSNGQALAGFIASPDAIAIAARVPEIQNGYPGVDATVIQAKNGFPVLLQQFYSPRLGMWTVSATGLFGVGNGTSGSLSRIIDTNLA